MADGRQSEERAGEWRGTPGSEYDPPSLGLPGWGAASILVALPAVVLILALPLLISRGGVPWSILRPMLLAIPVGAVVGTLLGVVAVRRSEGSVTATIGLGLNLVLLAMVAAVVFIWIF